MTFEDVPEEFLSALNHAERIVSWESELSQDEMPPVWVRPLWWEMEKWMARVVSERKAKYGGSSGDVTDWDSPEYERNELLPDWAKEL